MTPEGILPNFVISCCCSATFHSLKPSRPVSDPQHKQPKRCWSKRQMPNVSRRPGLKKNGAGPRGKGPTYHEGQGKKKHDFPSMNSLARLLQLWQSSVSLQSSCHFDDFSMEVFVHSGPLPIGVFHQDLHAGGQHASTMLRRARSFSQKRSVGKTHTHTRQEWIII